MGCSPQELELEPMASERVAEIGRLPVATRDGRDSRRHSCWSCSGSPATSSPPGSATCPAVSGAACSCCWVLAEPNVLLLDEPTNDVDTDMLAATEDLLDSWPGTLIVVSHDRYLLERVTDQQYAILDGRLRHLPGGIDEYLRLAAQASVQRGVTATAAATAKTISQQISGAELRSVQKEIAAIDRRLARFAEQIEAKHRELAEHDQSDHVGLPASPPNCGNWKMTSPAGNRWMEVSEVLE